MLILPLVYHELGCVALETVRELGLSAPIVVTHRDRTEENTWFSSTADAATKHGSAVVYSEDLSDSQLLELADEVNPDLILSVYFRRIIRNDVIAVPRYGAVNLHGSLLPKYRGRAPVNWQIVNGETKSGLTLHYMVASADAGDVISQLELEISPGETALSLYQKMVPAARRMLREELRRVPEWRARAWPQDHSQATVFGGRNPADGLVDWSQTAESIGNLVRGVTRPYPGAFGRLGDKKVTIWSVAPADRDDLPIRPAGTVIQMQERIFARARDRWLELIDVDVSTDATGEAVPSGVLNGRFATTDNT